MSFHRLIIGITACTVLGLNVCLAQTDKQDVKHLRYPGGGDLLALDWDVPTKGAFLSYPLRGGSTEVICGMSNVSDNIKVRLDLNSAKPSESQMLRLWWGQVGDNAPEIFRKQDHIDLAASRFDDNAPNDNSEIFVLTGASMKKFMQFVSSAPVGIAILLSANDRELLQPGTAQFSPVGVQTPVYVGSLEKAMVSDEPFSNMLKRCK